jgi:hypothetical protein
MQSMPYNENDYVYVLNAECWSRNQNRKKLVIGDWKRTEFLPPRKLNLMVRKLNLYPWRISSTAKMAGNLKLIWQQLGHVNEFSKQLPCTTFLSVLQYLLVGQFSMKNHLVICYNHKIVQYKLNLALLH